MNSLVQNLKKQIIEALNLEEIAPEDIDEREPLFGEGLGLDSIDALELVVLVEKHYGILITDADIGKKAFLSVSALAELIREHEPA